MNRAADGLVVVEQFLNTLDERTFNRHGSTHQAADELTSTEALATWFAAHGLLAQGDQVDAGALEVARSLRGALRVVLTEGPADDRSAAAVLADFPLRLAPAASGTLRLAAATGSGGLDAIVETVATSVAEGRWKRLKLCDSEDCRWAFYDTSRGGGGRWCSMEVCGNRHKTRAYRRRQAQSDDQKQRGGSGSDDAS